MMQMFFMDLTDAQQAFLAIGLTVTIGALMILALWDIERRKAVRDAPPPFRWADYRGATKDR
jgi:hypothetical protein